MSVTDEIIERLSDVNIVSFSGGKDSTVVLQHVVSAIGDSGKKLFIVTADTLMEIPYFNQYLNRTKTHIKNFINLSGMNAELVTVLPKIEDSFWVSILGKGYPSAHMGFRWCTGKLKIEPIVKFINSITKDKKFTVFVGVRSAESALRARIYTKKDYKPNHFAPILNWSSHDVWEYLLTEPCPWGVDHSELVNVYKYSSDECVYGEKQGVCIGNARYGCWACPLQANMQLDMIGVHTNDVLRYKALKRFKNLIVGAANRSAARSQIRRNGEKGTGPFLVEIRMKLYDELKKTEKLTGWQLITQREEELIREHWAADKNVHNKADKTQQLLWGFLEQRNA